MKYSVKLFLSLSENVFKSLRAIVLGNISVREMSGPVGTVDAVADAAKSAAAETDYSGLVLIMALLCINLGIFNLLPIPALDGGHIAFVIIEKLRKKPVPQYIQNTVTTAFFVFLLGFMAFITISDIFKFFK